MKRFSLAAILLLSVLTAHAGAQTVVNPRIVEFDPSADHATLLEGGVPAVTEYALELYLQGAASPFYTMSLGKPAPQGDGKIRYDFSANIAAWPLTGGIYESRVTAVGPTGTGRSTVSNTFSFVTCSYLLAPTSATVGATSGSSNFSVTAATGCVWTVTTPATWVSLITTAGTGLGTVSFSYAANTLGTPRSATITVGSQAFALTQSGVACTVTVTPLTLSVTAQAGSANVVLTTPGGCPSWTATSNAPWATVGTASGTGSATIAVSYQVHTGTASRSATITVGGQTVALAQASASSVSPGTFALPATASGTTAIAVTALAGWAWQATTSTSWITLGTSSGTGNGTATFTIAANPDGTARTGSIAIGEHTIGVAQAAAACGVTVTPLTLSVGAPAGSVNVAITTPGGCAWTATSSASWVTVGTASGSGSASVTLTYQGHTATTPRSTTITVGGVTVPFTQLAFPAPVAPKNLRVVTAGD